MPDVATGHFVDLFGFVFADQGNQTNTKFSWLGPDVSHSVVEGVGIVSLGMFCTCICWAFVGVLWHNLSAWAIPN